MGADMNRRNGSYRPCHNRSAEPPVAFNGESQMFPASRSARSTTTYLDCGLAKSSQPTCKNESISPTRRPTKDLKTISPQPQESEDWGPVWDVIDAFYACFAENLQLRVRLAPSTFRDLDWIGLATVGTPTCKNESPTDVVRKIRRPSPRPQDSEDGGRLVLKIGKSVEEILQEVGVRQGDNMAPVLFLFLMNAFADSLEKNWESKGLER
ncbi:hypothetical protein THAOC_03513, partial [Thalassiosira oceanica]